MIRIKNVIVLSGLLLSQIGPLQAAKWNFTPYLTIGEIYTDNVTLAPEGEEQEDFITLVNPGFTLRREQGRVRANVAYQMQNLFYAKESDFNETFHQLDAFGVAEIVREHFFVDAASSISQQVIDAEQAASLSNRSVTGNRTDVITASVSPYLRQEFGSAAQALARYSYGIVDFDDDEVADPVDDDTVDDATVHGGVIAVGSQRRTGRRLSWLGAYQQERVDFEGTGAVDTFERGGLRFDYSLTRGIGLVALGGYEDNEFERTTTTLEPEGAFWEAGFRLEPTARDLFEARYGERFFGNTYFVSWDHFGQRFATDVSYSEDVTTVAQSLLGGAQELLEPSILDPDADALDPEVSGTPQSLDAFAEPVDPGTGLPVGFLSLTSEVFVVNRLDAGLSFNTARTKTRINVFQEERDFVGPGESQDERIRGIQTLFDWQFASRTDFIAGFDYAREDFREDDQSADLIRVRLGLLREIGSRTVGRLEAVRTERDSDDNLDEYVENAVIVSVTRRF